MKTIQVLSPFILGCLLWSTPAAAEDHQTDVAPSVSGNRSSGTAPRDMGSTGWTGGSRGQTRDAATVGQGAQPSRHNAEPPEVASGRDLTGPPQKFPADKTPE